MKELYNIHPSTILMMGKMACCGFSALLIFGGGGFFSLFSFDQDSILDK